MKDFKVNNFIESVFNSLSWASKIDVRGAFSSLSKKVSRIFSFNLRKSDDPNTHLPLKSKRVSTNPSSKFTIRSMWSRINVQSPSLQKLPLKDEIELTNLSTFEEKLESLRQIKEAMLTEPMANFDGQKYVHASSFEMSLSRLFEDLVRLTADSFLVEKTQNGDFSLDCFRKILNISGEQGDIATFF